MAVRTKNTEILQPVVGRITVDVIERQRQGLPAPFVETAALAPSFLEAGHDQPTTEIAAADVGRVRDQDFVEWPGLESVGIAATLPPRLTDEMARVEPQPPEVLVDEALYSPAGCVTQTPENLRDSRAVPNRVGQLAVRPRSDPAGTASRRLREVGRIDVEARNVPPQRGVGPAAPGKPEREHHLAHRGGVGDCRPEVIVCPLTQRHDHVLARGYDSFRG
ncbi:hypothetical protein [Jatrophihabitans fulvus]